MGQLHLLVELGVRGATELHELNEVRVLALAKGMMRPIWSGLAPSFSSSVMIYSVCRSSFLFREEVLPQAISSGLWVI